MERKFFIIFGEDFDRHPHALEHILRPLFGEHQFLWVETMGLRSPKFNLYDLKRAFEKISRMFSGNTPSQKRPPPKNVKVISPFMIPFNQFNLIRFFNRWSVLREVKKHLPDGINPISITSVPNSCDYVGAFNESLKVYFCVDEFSLWPGLDYELVKKMENKLLEEVDLIIATSDQLAKTKTKGEEKTEVITHGVEFERFDLGAKELGENFKLCYFGLFDERTDQSILSDIVQEFSDLEIHIIGPVVCNIDNLSVLPRIFFHGRVPYDELPLHIREMDAFILPYVRSELTDNINPLKLKEYLATSRPVLATALPEVAKLKQHLSLFNTSKEAIELIKAIRSPNSPHSGELVREYVLGHETWKAKSQRLVTLLQSALNARSK